jgi:hypothetical protein
MTGVPGVRIGPATAILAGDAGPRVLAALAKYGRAQGSAAER